MKITFTVVGGIKSATWTICTIGIANKLLWCVDVVRIRPRWSSLAHVKTTSTVALSRESLYLPFNSLVNEVLATIARFGIFASTDLRLLLHLYILLRGLAILIRGAKVGRWCKILTLVEMGEVRCVFINRLRAFLGLIWNSEAHVCSIDRVTSRVELLNTLRQIRVL